MTKKLRKQLYLDRLPTPIGESLIVTDEDGHLRAFDWADHEADMARSLRRHYVAWPPTPSAMPGGLKRLLQSYFEGNVNCLASIEWRAAGTPFQSAVWSALATIAPGQTISYSALALMLGRPESVRAVGLANGANPISVVVPCHRVIGADGSLTGYGGGLHRKRWLLEHESAATHSMFCPRHRATGSALDNARL